MQISYTLTERDLREGFTVHRDRTSFTKWLFRVFPAVTFLFCAYGVVQSVIHPGEQKLATYVPVLGIGILWAILVWGGPRYTANKQFQCNKVMQLPRTLGWDDTGLHSACEVSSGDTAWNGLLDWREGESVFLLYYSPESFFVVPKRALTSEEVAEFRERLNLKIKNKA
jgi:hypothetical protein